MVHGKKSVSTKASNEIVPFQQELSIQECDVQNDPIVHPESKSDKKIGFQLSVLLVLQLLLWRCVECVIHHKWDVRKEQHHIQVARTSSNRVITVHELYSCLLPQCKALRTCRSGFPIAALGIWLHPKTSILHTGTKWWEKHPRGQDAWILKSYLW